MGIYALFCQLIGIAFWSSHLSGRLLHFKILVLIYFSAPNEDYSPGNLQQINDNIYLNLFDEVVVDIQEVRDSLN